jgi:peptidoglycan LD-endopeptidase LytH
MRDRVGLRGWVLVCGAALVAGGCAPALTARVDGAPRGAYERELSRSRVHGAAVAREWAALGDAAARGAARVTLPLDLVLDVPAARPSAAAYRFTLRAGDRLQAQVAPPRPRERGVFLELFEVVPGAEERLLLIAHSNAGGAALRTLAPRAAEYVLLIQPRMEGGGRYRVAIGTGALVAPIAVAPADATLAAGLGFPVAGHTMRAIGSVFGDPRDGGARAHHGVDIFAPRGTPVLAAADGTITNVANTSVGGLVVWQRVDPSGIELYYAHLDAQHVHRGQFVRAGDPIGTVGNTGNARTTPPHLHFGVYSPGRNPLDPSPLLAAGTIVTDRPVALAPPPSAPRPPPTFADRPAHTAGNNDEAESLSAGGIPGATVRPVAGPAAETGTAGASPVEHMAGFSTNVTRAGQWLRTRPEPASLHEAPVRGTRGIALEPGTPVRVLAGSDAWYRVALPGGATGFVPVDAVAGFDGPPAARRAITARTPLRTGSAAGAQVIETIYGGEHVDVLAVYDGQQLVRTTTGQIGWITAP